MTCCDVAYLDWVHVKRTLYHYHMTLQLLLHVAYSPLHPNGTIHPPPLFQSLSISTLKLHTQTAISKIHV